MKDAVVLIPSYEPDELLLNVVHELQENDFPILLVNDGSGPEFDYIFNQVKDGVKYLAFEKNQGKGAAMKYGYSKLLEFYPNAKYVITADGDGQHALKDIIRVYDELVKHNQLVFGVRSFDRKVPFRSRFGNDFSKTTRSLATKQYIQDDQCGLRGFPIRYINDLLRIKGSRYEYEMNQIVSFQMMQAPLYTIPIETIYLDNNSRSHFSPFKDTFRIQSIIFLCSLHSVIFLALQMFLIVIGIKHEVFPLIVTVYLAYTAVFLLWFLVHNIIYPTKSFFRRLFKELFFVALKMATCHLILELTLTVFHWNYYVMVPIAVISATTMNVLFSWLLRKMFPSF